MLSGTSSEAALAEDRRLRSAVPWKPVPGDQSRRGLPRTVLTMQVYQPFYKHCNTNNINNVAFTNFVKYNN